MLPAEKMESGILIKILCRKYENIELKKNRHILMISLFPNVGCLGSRPKIISAEKKMLTTVDRDNFPNLIMVISRTGFLEDRKPYA